MAILSATQQTKGVLAIDIDETLAAPGEWNDDLIALLIKTKQENPDLHVVLFSSYHPQFFKEQLNKNLTRSQVKDKLESEGLHVDAVLLTESNQYESDAILPGNRLGDFFENVIAKIEHVILAQKPDVREMIFKDVINQLSADIDSILKNSLPQLNDAASEARYKAMVTEEMKKVMALDSVSFRNKENLGAMRELVRRYRNGFKMLGIDDDASTELAKSFVIAQLNIKLNTYSKQYLLDPSNKHGKVMLRRDGQPFSGNEAKEMMMRHLKSKGYTHVFLVDDSNDVGNLFKLQHHDAKSEVADGIKSGDNLLENVSGFKFIGLKNLNLYKAQAAQTRDKDTLDIIATHTVGLGQAMTEFSDHMKALKARERRVPPPVDKSTKPTRPIRPPRADKVTFLDATNSSSVSAKKHHDTQNTPQAEEHRTKPKRS